MVITSYAKIDLKEEKKMHELGLMAEVVRVVQQTITNYKVKKVDTIVLQIGELTPIVPQICGRLLPCCDLQNSTGRSEAKNRDNSRRRLLPQLRKGF